MKQLVNEQREEVTRALSGRGQYRFVCATDSGITKLSLATLQHIWNKAEDLVYVVTRGASGQYINVIPLDVFCALFSLLSSS